MDILLGLGGNDSLNGGPDADTLIGGAGRDSLTGGTGNDIFVFSKGEANGDKIFDFAGNGIAVGDSILLTGWSAGSTFTQTSTANVWIITDRLDYSVESVTVIGAVHPTDIVFG